MGHGPAFLTREELESCLHRHVSAYYNFLCKNWFAPSRRAEVFGAITSRRSKSRAWDSANRRLALAVLAGIVTASLNPQFTVQKVMSRRQQSEVSREHMRELEVAPQLHPGEIR